ncbi:MAG: hypothetical protein ABIO70_07340 [Pseudomonadota bacterium]
MTRPRHLILAVLCWAIALPALADTDIPTARVVLPWSDFKTLYEQGKAPKDVPERAPRDFAISRAVYTGTVQEESTLFDLKLKVEVLKDKGWVVVPLLPTTAALRSATLAGKDAPVFLQDGWYALVTDKKGVLDLTLQFAVSTWESGGQNGFSFAMAPSGGTEVTLTVPAEDTLDFQVANAQQTEKQAVGDRQQLHALLPATGNLSVTWQRASAEEAVEGAPAEQARVYAEHQALVGVSEGLLQCSSVVNYSILHAGLDRFTVDLPADVTVLDVKGNGLRDWSVAQEGERNVVAAELNFEAKGSYSLYVTYEKPLPEGSASVVVPDLHVHDVERVKGWVGIDARSALEIGAGAVQDASTVDVRELPTAILGQTTWPVLLGFKYRKQDWVIPLEIRQHEDVDMLVTIVDSLAATSVMTRDGRRMTQLVYSMRNNRAQVLRLTMPEGAEVWSAFVGGRAAKPAKGEDGRLLVPLARSTASGGALASFAVELVYVESSGAPDAKGHGTYSASLPVADVPCTQVAWTAYVPYETKVKPKLIDSTLRKVDYFTSVSTAGYAVDAMQVNFEVQQQAAAAFAGEAAAAGVQPVRVALPIDGWAMMFEKLLVLDEPLTLTFPYTGLEP